MREHPHLPVIFSKASISRIINDMKAKKPKNRFKLSTDEFIASCKAEAICKRFGIEA